MIGEDFPQLNIPPNDLILSDSRKMQIIHQVSQIYVFEDREDPFSEKNGTLKLLARLEEHMTPNSDVMHAIRKEFLKKVFESYIRHVPISHGDYNEDA